MAAAVTVLALVSRLLLEAAWGASAFHVFALAVTIAAAFGGLGPGLLATAASALALTWFVPPRFELTVERAMDGADLVLLVVVGICISLISERARRALARSRATEEKLRESEARFRSAVMAAPFPAVIHADDGQILDINGAWTELSGYTRADIPTIAAWLEKAYEEPLRSQVRASITRLRTLEQTVEQNEFTVRTASGEQRAWSFGAAALGRDGLGRRLVVSVASDVTALRRFERERELLLDSERAARTEAERANRMKDDFLAMISHELRTPLNAILGWTQLLRRAGGAPEHLERSLDVIERNTKLQAQLISDLLDVSRITSGKLHLELSSVDLPLAVEAAIDACRPAAQAKQVTLDATIDPTPVTLRGDLGRMQQVMTNLITNAVKFTPSGGRVTVSLARRGEHALIAVRDTGQGIAPELLPHVFERFRQADASMARRHGGLGLGLAIVEHLVGLHGGEVHAESEGIGRGATFTITLPCEVEPSRAPSAPAPGLGIGSGLEGVRVLVVDDDEHARELVKRVLEEHDATVMTAASGPEAIDVLGTVAPDVLVSDLGMPGMDGYALIHAVRAGGGRVPAVAVTAFARPEDRQRALSAGYQAHLAKPIEPGDLVMAVKSLRQAAA